MQTVILSGIAAAALVLYMVRRRRRLAHNDE